VKTRTNIVALRQRVSRIRLSRRRAGSHRRLHLLLASAVIATSVAVLAPHAAGYRQLPQGRPGAWTLFKIHGSHFNPCASNRPLLPPPPGSPYWIAQQACFTPWVVARGPFIRRAPGTRRRQSIVARYELQRWSDGQWTLQAKQEFTGYIAAGLRSLQLPNVNFLPTKALHLRVLVGVAWYDTHRRRELGARAAEFIHRGDYLCSTRFPCEVGDGWVWLRAPGT